LHSGGYRLRLGNAIFRALSGEFGSMLRRQMKWALIGGALCALAVLPAPAQPASPVEVDIKLVIATDNSHSITNEEEQLQRQGIADLFLDPEVLKAIQSGPLGRIAVAMLDWAGYREDKIVLDWTVVKDKESAANLAAKVREIPRMLGQRTSISNAVERGIAMLNESERRFVANRRAIDVSGDGPNNDGVSMQQVHDATKDNGIMVNGLPIMDETSDAYFPDLDKYYAACVVSGKNGFLIVVKSYKDFGAAMRRKLVLEISQDRGQIEHMLGELAPNPLFKTIAAGAPPARSPLQPPVKEYPGGCDKYGGWKTFGP
jgi:uncharacterized protein DUF1194